MDSAAHPTSRPTIADLTGDNNFAKVARRHWLTKTPPKALPQVLETDIWRPLEDENFPYFSLVLLEQLQCLERCLWPTYSEDASDHHTILTALLVNVKRREHLATFEWFGKENVDAFSTFFRRVLELSIDASLSTHLRTHILTFIIGAFQSLDAGIVRRECAPLVGIGTWQHIHSDSAREQLLSKSPQLQKAWRAAAKKLDNAADEQAKGRVRFERSWLYTLLLDFLDTLYKEDIPADQKHENLAYCERLVELLADLQAQLPTRRYVNTLLQDLSLLPAIRLSPLFDSGSDAAVLRDMYKLLAHYTDFPIDDHSGRQLSREEYDEAHNSRIARLQKVALRLHSEKLKILILANYGSLAQRGELTSHLEVLTDAELVQLGDELGLRTEYPDKSLVVRDRTFYLEILGSSIEIKSFYADAIQHELPNLPTEATLYDTALLRPDHYTGDHPLPIPKLNLQYLSTPDFLYRSFILARIEAFYALRKHLEDTLKRLQPRRQPSGDTRFDGFSRMAIPIPKPAIIETVPPKVGEEVPAEVKVEVTLDVSRLQPGLRREWEGLRDGDVVYLVAVQPADADRRLTNGHKQESEAEKIGLKTLRCAEVASVLDENGRFLRHDAERDEFSRPRQRRLMLRLDAAAYQKDKTRADAGKGDVYDSINLIVRRKARENNFKPILETIRQLILSDTSLPAWLRDVFLGFGDPSSANYKRMEKKLKKVDYRDTFLDWQHLIESLPGKTVEPDEKYDASFPAPYVLEDAGTAAAPAPAKPTKQKKRKRDQMDDEQPAAQQAVEAVKVSTYKPPNTGPYPTDVTRTNAIRFTPAQIEAITSGTQPGLTLIVGPPGTGKTDVTVQIISNIYHNFPQQRTLLVAHSNQALNQLFQKIIALDIDERHLLRLGHGEEELQTGGSFSKAGRVESFMERGGQYLAEVQRLADSIGAVGAHGSSCETAEYFERVWIRPRWRRFWDAVESSQDENAGRVHENFSFHTFFANAPQPLFSPTASNEEAVEIAKGCERHIQRIFDELADLRPCEILRNQRDKSNYLLTKEARVIAMTSTHAAMRRQEIARLGFRYENVVMEEAAQITEIENFIPLVMQDSATRNGQDTGGLQRVVLVGDHLQNSPVIQNPGLKAYAGMEQSLFQRLIRLGVPHILLDAQGRSRPSLAALYKWRYQHLTNLPFTASAPEFVQANAGLRHDYQFIDVPDYKGKGESEPTPHYFQNLGEAEYAVALYQYMRLLGYPAEKISILCTYAGQRALVRDVLTHRCKGNRLFGMPGWVGTVDKYQGEQNDYVILSLVRTKAPGYLRDLRRLTVAVSRARLGLYVFGRREVFDSSLELKEAFEMLSERPAKLELVPGEMWPAARGVADEVKGVEIEGLEHLGQYVYEMTQAKVKQLKDGGGMLPPQARNGGRVEDDDAEEDGLPGADGEEQMDGELET